MRLLTVAALSSLVAGCVTWTHSTKTEQEYHADSYECERDAAVVKDPFQALGMRVRCMRVKGWREQ